MVKVKIYSDISVDRLVGERIRFLLPHVIGFVIDHPGVFQLEGVDSVLDVLEVDQLIEVGEEVDGVGIDQVDRSRFVVVSDENLQS